MSERSDETGPSCPLPRSHDTVTLAHGGGGRRMRELIDGVFASAFRSSTAHDGHVTPVTAGRIATTTDAFVVRPMEFPGGDIGSLAVHGTVNDLAMCGARPLHLAAAFILEEGVEIATLQRIAASMARACAEVGTSIVTGDTKVVEHGHGDGVYITMTGTGLCEHDLEIHPRSIRAGDAIVLSGDVGRHGMAVMSARETLSIECDLHSDARELWTPVAALLRADVELHCLRDLTRGGLGTALNELAIDGGVEIEVDERCIPTIEPVRSLCDLLGMDPLYVACEGRFVAIVPADQAERTVQTLAAAAPDERPAVIGHVTAGRPGQVALKTRLGTLRHLPMPSGEQLPRIC